MKFKNLPILASIAVLVACSSGDLLQEQILALRANAPMPVEAPAEVRADPETPAQTEVPAKPETPSPVYPSSDELKVREQEFIRETLQRPIDIEVNAECLKYLLSKHTFRCPDIVDKKRLDQDLKDAKNAIAFYRTLDDIDDLKINVAVELHVTGNADGARWRNRLTPLRLWQRFLILREKFHGVRDHWPARDQPNQVLACTRGLELLNAVEPSIEEFRQDIKSVRNITSNFITDLQCVVHDEVGEENRGASYRIVFTVYGRPEFREVIEID